MQILEAVGAKSGGFDLIFLTICDARVGQGMIQKMEIEMKGCGSPVLLKIRWLLHSQNGFAFA